MTNREVVHREDVEEVFHFSIENYSSKLPTLLRQVARHLADLDAVKVCDITYQLDFETGASDPDATVTVYYQSLSWPKTKR